MAFNVASKSGGEMIAASTVRHQDELPLVLTMEHIQKILGLSRLKAYELPHQQGFPVVRFGRAIRVPRDAFLKWLETQAGGDL
jgi:excisionase family DNA binding protein